MLVRGFVQAMTRVATVVFICCLSTRALAQLAPTGDHYGGRASDTGFSGKVNAGGGYSAAVPLDLSPARGGIAIPVQIVFGGHTVGAAGVGWDLPLSYVRDDVSIAKRKPRNKPNAPATGRRRVTMSLAGQSLTFVPQGTAWVSANDAAMFKASDTGAGWVVEDGSGNRYTFSESAGPGLWLLKKVDGPSGAVMTLAYAIQQVNLTGGRATSVDLTNVSYNYNPDLGCAKDVIELVYGDASPTPLSLSVMPSIFVRMRTLDHINVRMRSSCSSILTVRSYAFHYTADADTQLPRLESVTMTGRADKSESTTPLPVARYHYGSASHDGQITFAPNGTITPPSGVDGYQITSGSKVSMSLPGGGQSYATFQSLTDLTGDGRPDFLYQNLGTVWIGKNRPGVDGATTFPQTGSILGDTALSISGPVSANTLTRTRFDDGIHNNTDPEANKTNDWRQLIDINGDGRVDIIDAAKRDGLWTVYLNTPSNGGSGVAWEERVIPTKQLRDRLAMYGHTFPDNTHLPLSRHYTAHVFYTDDVGQARELDREYTYTEWELKDINGDGLPDFVFNTLPVQMITSVVSPYKTMHVPQPGPGANAIEVMFNVSAVTLSGTSNTPAQAQQLFSAPSILTENTSCGVEMWEEGGYKLYDRDTFESLRCTLMDVTGDGIVDRIDHDHALIGMGTGFSSISVPLPVDFVGKQHSYRNVCLGQTGSYTFSSSVDSGLRDVTGDGIADLIVNGSPLDTIYVGTGFGFAATPLHGNIGLLSRQQEACDGTSSTTHSGMFDVDGDGRPDIIGLKYDGTYGVSSLTDGTEPGIPSAGQLVAIDNGYGATTEITYRSAKRDSTTAHDVPFPEIVVASVRTRRATQTPADSLAPTMYAYGNPELVYDNAAGAFVFAGYRRSVSLQATGSNADQYIGQATITDTLGLAPFGGGAADVRYARRANVGRLSSVTTLAGNLGIDPWKLLATNVDTDYRQTSRTTYKYTSKYFHEAPVPAEPMLDCLDWPTPYNYDGSLGDALLGYDTCSSHGLTYANETLALRGEPIANQNNVWTKTRVLEVDDFGRTTKIAYDNDVFRWDDDLCVETVFATPESGGPRILTATATRRVSTSCAERPITLRRDTYELDNLPTGKVSIGNQTSHTVDLYATDNGAHTSTVREFDATYDSLGNVIHTIAVRDDGVYRDATLTYDPFGLVVTSSVTTGTNVPTMTSTAELDPFTLDPISSTEPNGTRRKLEYDGFGRVVTTSVAPAGGALGILSRTTYGGFFPASTERVISTVRFDEPTPESQLGSTRGHMSRTIIDEIGRVTREETSLGADYSGQMIISGYRTFDPFGRVSFEAEPFLSTERAETAYGTTHYYKADGRPNCSVRAQGPHELTPSSDLANEVFAQCFYHGYSNHLETFGTSDADANQYGTPQFRVIHMDTVTAIGRLVSRVTTRSGQVLEYSTATQDRFGQTVSETRFKNPASNPPSGPVTSTTRFDSAGHVLQQTDPEGQVTSAALNSWGLPTAVFWSDPATNPPTDRRIVANYDAYGRLIHRHEQRNGEIDAESVNDFTYDAGSVVAPQVTPANLVGRLASSHAASGDTFYSYDAYGLVGAMVWNDDAGQQYVEKLGHRADGTLTSMDLYLPDRNYDQEHVQYLYDSANRLVGANYSSSTQQRTLYKVAHQDPFGRIKKATYGETTLEAEFSERGRRLPKYATLVSPLGQRRFEYGMYDAVGREMSRYEDSSTQATETQHKYDAIGRLVGSQDLRAGQTVANWSYTYDPLGNLSTASNSVAGSTTSMTYRPGDQDQLCRIDFAPTTNTACNVTHDYFGNVTSMPSKGGTRSLDYFLSGRIRSIRDARNSATFRYNPDGDVQEIRIETFARESRYEQRYGNIEVRTSRNARGAGTTTISRKFPGPGASVSLRGTGTTWIYELSDARGLRVTTSAEGNFVQDVSYQPFGAAASTGQSTTSPLYTFDQWNGGEALTNFGLTQLGARIYDPHIGRFLSRDPLKIFRSASKSNPYAFAANDPVNHSDPSGLDWANDCMGQECLAMDWVLPWGNGGSTGGGHGGGGNQGGGTSEPPRPKMPPMTGMTDSACQFADGSAGCNDSMWPTFRNLSRWGRVKQTTFRGGRGAWDGFQYVMDGVDNWVHRHPGLVFAATTFVVAYVAGPEILAWRTLGFFGSGLGLLMEEFGPEAPMLGEEAIIADEAAMADSGLLATEPEYVIESSYQAERLRASYAAQQIVNAERIGSGLKPDATHRAASFVELEQLEAGQAYTFRGGDGVQRVLLQTPGELNDKAGIFEYILDPSGYVTHQRFINGGMMTGFPNQ